MRNAIACVVVLMFVPCTLYADPIGPTIGYWRFDEGVADATAIDDNSVLDSSGNGLHGTPVLEPVYRSDVPPSFPGNSLSMEFDGITGQRVVVPDHALFELTHSLTLEAFIKAQPMKPGTGGGADIILRGDARPGLDPYRLTLNQPGDTLVFAIVDENQNYADVQAPIPYDTWLHVAGTLDDATGAMKLYINGSEVASTITSIRPLGPLDPFSGPAVSIGEDPDGQYGEAFNGLIDEVRISNVALEPGQFLVPEPSLLCMLLPLLVGWGRRPARWGVNCTAPRKHSLRYGLHRVDGGGVACYKEAFLTERGRRSFDRKPLTLNPAPLRMSICERKKEIRRRRKRAEKLTKLKKRLPKATKSEQVEIARKVRDITPGAEVVIANWGLAAVDR